MMVDREFDLRPNRTKYYVTSYVIEEWEQKLVGSESGYISQLNDMFTHELLFLWASNPTNGVCLVQSGHHLHNLIEMQLVLAII